jgi:hypothetical protein
VGDGVSDNERGEPVEYLEHVRASAVANDGELGKVDAMIAATEAFADAIRDLENAKSFDDPFLYPERPDYEPLVNAVASAHRALFAAAGLLYDPPGE